LGIASLYGCTQLPFLNHQELPTKNQTEEHVGLVEPSQIGATAREKAAAPSGVSLAWKAN
jgi:hypothetical protein